MLIWMTGIVSMATALCAAAWLAEKAARAIRAPTRWIWALAILGSLLLPAATRCLSAEWSSLSALIPARIAAPTGNSGQLKLRQLSQSLGGASVANKWKQYDALLSYAWIAMTLGSSVVLIISHATWLRRRRIWTRGTLNQSAVYFAANFGPAVMGFIRPSIIVPVWLKHSPPAQQALVLAHESSHIDAHDPQLLTAALALVVAMPWNVPLWWQLLRLRRAVEIDCDARVLAGGHDAARYGETLLEVGQRQSRIIGTAIAMSESPSFLEERIAIMIGKPAQSARIAAIGFTGLAMVLAAVATQIAPANGLPPIAATAGVGPEVLVKLTQSALDGFAGYYKGSEISVMVVAREEDHLILQSSGEA